MNFYETFKCPECDRKMGIGGAGEPRWGVCLNHEEPVTMESRRR